MARRPFPAPSKLLRVISIVAIYSVVLTSVTEACLWDWDTLQMERRRFPGALELITGKFVRHSQPYYQWRIQDRTKRMRSPAENPELADDLAVALSKLGNHAEAIALLERVLEKYPDRYETLSNLGTIQMLAGDLKTGKEYIDRAIIINPDAHFGREKYQSLLAEYWLTARKTPHEAAPSEGFFTLQSKHSPIGFARFVVQKRLPGNTNPSNEEISDELHAAEKGVLGMMHFADYESPMLLEVLGDVLISFPEYKVDAMHLAARAYYRIAQLSSDEQIKTQFKAVAERMVEGNLDYVRLHEQQQSNKPGGAVAPSDLEKLSADLEQELASAHIFVAAIEADEKKWIAQGVNVDKAFAAKYYDSLNSTIEEAKQQLSREPRDIRGNPFEEGSRRALLILGILVLGIVAIVSGCGFAIRRYRGRRKLV